MSKLGREKFTKEPDMKENRNTTRFARNYYMMLNNVVRRVILNAILNLHLFKRFLCM